MKEKARGQTETQPTIKRAAFASNTSLQSFSIFHHIDKKVFSQQSDKWFNTLNKGCNLYKNHKQINIRKQRDFHFIINMNTDS